MTKIAFLGTGLMGAPMVRNIMAGGFAVNVWNRTASKAQALREDGANFCKTVQECLDDADIIITMLSDGDAVHDIIFAQDSHIKTGACLVDTSSIKPEQARNHAKLLYARQIGHVDAPVSGGTRGAIAGTLAIMAGGAEEHFAQAKPVLATMGRPVHVGAAGAGQLAKLANQAIVAVTIGVVAEAMLLLADGGADPQAVRNALQGGFADSTILQQHGARMTNGDFIPGGRSVLQLKDLENLLEEARMLDLHLPLAELLRDRFAHFCHDMGHGELDHSGLYLELLARNKR